MASEQIQKLTSTLYQEGVEKGEKKAAEIIDDARKTAEAILAKARSEAELILKDAEEKARAQKQHVETETRIAAKEIMHDFHHRVMDMILVKAIDEKIEAAFEQKNLSHWIAKIIENWKSDSKEQAGIHILLSEKDRENFDQWFKKEVAKTLHQAVHVRFSDSFGGGFQIIAGGEGYKIDMSIEAFEELFRHYLKTRTRKLLFGE